MRHWIRAFVTEQAQNLSVLQSLDLSMPNSMFAGLAGQE